MHVCSALYHTCEFARVRDTCEVFDSAVARVCVCYSEVSHVCVYMMLDSTTMYKSSVGPSLQFGVN